MNIILSIHPEYVEKILAGEKTVELRRLLPRQNVEKIYIYSTSPVKKIVGYFTGRRFDYNMNFANMIEIHKKACVNGFWMYDYFHGGPVTGFEIFRPVRFRDPVPLSIGIRPPQNFCYSRNDINAKIICTKECPWPIDIEIEKSLAAHPDAVINWSITNFSNKVNYHKCPNCNVIIPIWRDEGRENAANN